MQNIEGQIRESKLQSGKEVLVHDGHMVVVRHGPEAVTGTGNPGHKMVVGTPAELDVEITRLGLRERDSAAPFGPSGRRRFGRTG